MPFEKLRFLHVGHLRLGEQPRERMHVPQALRAEIWGLSIETFRRVTECAVHEGVDFILITGETLSVPHFDLRSESALCDGLQRLLEADIRVFVMPATQHERTVWAQLDVPPNTTILEAQADADAVAVVRDGRLIASLITNLAHPEPAPANDQTTANGPLRLGIAAPSQLLLTTQDSAHPARESDRLLGQLMAEHRLDYLALAEPAQPDTQRHQHAVSHHPGICLPLSHAEHDGGLCSLVEVTQQRQIHCRRVVICPAEWNEVTIPIDQVDTPLQWQSVITETLDQLTFHDSTRVVFLRIRVAGTHASQFHRQAALRDQFGQVVQSRAERSAGPHIICMWSRKSDQLTTNRTSLGDDFQRIAQAALPPSPAHIRQLLDEAVGGDPQAVELLRALTQQLDIERIADRVLEHGTDWFEHDHEKEAA